jgi:site-specific recombinase XerD
VTEATLHVTEIGPMIRAAEEAVKDKSYRETPIGAEVARYVRTLRWEQAAAATIEAYEPVLAKLAIRFSDFASLADFCSPVGTEYLREFLDRNWGECAPATRARNAAIVRSAFAWAVDERICEWNPASPIKGPRVRNRERNPHDRATMIRLLGRQESLRDVVALKLLCKLALRKNELRLLQIRDVDLARNLILVHGKGDKDVLLPFEAHRDLVEDLYLHVQGERRGGDEYLLYPKARRLEPMDPASVHRWFKRCLERAELPTSIQTHELRHFAGDELWRATGNMILAQELLRHESVGTTQRYLHPRREDLSLGMRVVAEAWKADEA